MKKLFLILTIPILLLLSSCQYGECLDLGFSESDCAFILTPAPTGIPTIIPEPVEEPIMAQPGPGSDPQDLGDFLTATPDPFFSPLPTPTVTPVYNPVGINDPTGILESLKFYP